ncbi:MAG: iron-containing alcohol dehydrogenase, partial [Anaerolineales bacterium]
IKEGVDFARRKNVDLVIGFGGGSALDAGKAIAGLFSNPGDIYTYLEVVGAGQPLIHSALPYIAIPTTAGTGTEVTRNAVLGVPEKQVKVSLRSPMLLPRLALVDPQLTFSMPPHITASTGMDALTQLLEAYVSNRANPMTDALCKDGLQLAARALLRAYKNGQDADARQDMSLASLFGGLALANAKLGAVHGLAGVLGGMFDAPHGAICARLLPEVMQLNVDALAARSAENGALERYAEIAKYLTGDPGSSVESGVSWVRNLCRELSIPGLSRYGVRAERFPEIIEKAQESSSMKGNPIRLTSAELSQILNMALSDY